MKTRALCLLLLALLGASLGASVGATGGAAARERPAAPRWEPPPDTIVAVDGDADLGFTIHRYDGSTLSPPTRSETTAECTEHDTPVRVAACQAEADTWFRDLADLQAALAWARYDAAHTPPGRSPGRPAPPREPRR